MTPGLRNSVVKFQSDFGLEPDGVIEPGGPTESALSIALRARNLDGKAAVEELRDAFASIGDEGFVFRASPDLRGMGEWVDGRDEDLTGGKPGRTAGRSKTLIASKVRKFPFERPGQWILEGGGAGGGGVSGGRVEWSLLWRGITNRLFGDVPETEASEIPPGGKTEPMKRTEPYNGPELMLPPSPPEPPEEPEHKEEFPTEERAPTVTVSPVPEEGKPSLTIFPISRIS